jgi:hypothetical protein
VQFGERAGGSEDRTSQRHNYTAASISLVLQKKWLTKLIISSLAYIPNVAVEWLALIHTWKIPGSILYIDSVLMVFSSHCRQIA